MANIINGINCDSGNRRRYLIKDGVSQVGTISGLTQYTGYLQRDSSTYTTFQSMTFSDLPNYKYLCVEIMLTTAQYSSVGALLQVGTHNCLCLRGAYANYLGMNVLNIMGMNIEGTTETAIKFGQADTNTTVYRIYNAWVEK